MHDDNYYPWLSIWFEPSQTIKHVMASGRLKIITIILFVLEGYVAALVTPDLPTHSIFSGALMGLLLWPMTAFIALVFYLLGRLFRGQASYKEVFAVLVLSIIPDIVASVIVWVADAPVLEGILNFGIGIWTSILIVAMFATVESFGKARALGVMLLTALVLVLGFALIEYSMQAEDSAKENVLNVEAFHKVIRQKVDANASAKKISQLVVAGYDYVMDSDEVFRAYSTRYFDMFQPNVWQRNTMKTRDKMWMDAFKENKISEESLDPFFEQITAFNNQGQEGNNTWNLIAKEIPDNYIEYLDKKLQAMLESNITVPMVTLYDENGSRIHDMNHSRQFFVSQIYNKIGDFYSDEQDVDSWALRYTKKGIKACPLNPNTLYMTSYYDDNATANVARYDRVLRLIKGHDDLFEYTNESLYNNLGYQIYKAKMTQRYDEAITLLQAAYDRDKDFSNSLVTISYIYQERKNPKKSYQVLEKEALNFLNSSDETLKNKISRYWIFVRRLIDVSYALQDYKMTEYVCQKYLKLHDADYEDCHTDMTAIKKRSAEEKTSPVYSVWKQNDDPLDREFLQEK